MTQISCVSQTCASRAAGNALPRAAAPKASMRLAQWIENLYTWRDRRRSLHHLARMDDRLLQDIGLSRSDVGEALSGRSRRR